MEGGKSEHGLIDEYVARGELGDPTRKDVALAWIGEEGKGLAGVSGKVALEFGLVGLAYFDGKRNEGIAS